MKTLFILVLVCGTSEPRCDTGHARAYQAFRAPEGFVVCGPPGLMPLQNGALLPLDGEEQHTKCVLR